MPQDIGLEASDWAVADIAPSDAPLKAKFDYQELRETLEAIVSSMKAAASNIEAVSSAEPSTEPPSDS